MAHQKHPLTQFPEQGTLADGNLLAGIATRLGLTNPTVVLDAQPGAGNSTGETPVGEIENPPALAIYELRVDEATKPINVNITMTEIRKDPVQGMQRFLDNLGMDGVAQAKIGQLVLALPGVQAMLKTELGL